MDKSDHQLKYYQIAKLCIMVLLLLITPFLPTSIRPPYLYFLLNLLIIAVGAEAGLLSSFKPPDEYYKKHQPAAAVVLVNAVAPSKPIINTATTTTSLVETSSPINKETDHTDNQLAAAELGNERKVMMMKRSMEKSVSEKINVRVVKVRKVKKCPSMPSLFFIGGGEADHVEDRLATPRQVVVDEDHVEEEEDEEVEDALSGQELFTKAEMFIGNFYKQLKIQREDSWKRLQDFYHKAF